MLVISPPVSHPYVVESAHKGIENTVFLKKDY